MLKDMIMLFQTECVFDILPSINAWRTIEENNMETIDEITGAIFRNKSEILEQLTLGLIK